MAKKRIGTEQGKAVNGTRERGLLERLEEHVAEAAKAWEQSGGKDDWAFRYMNDMALAVAEAKRFRKKWKRSRGER